MNKTLLNAKFFYCRTEETTNTVKKNFPKITPVTLYDPAFGMNAYSEDKADDLIKKLKLEQIFKDKVILCTSCETSPISRFAFDKTKNPEEKLNEHRNLYAKLLDHVLEENSDVNILFLPHAIGPGKALDDRVIAKDIISRLESSSNHRVNLLDELLSAKELKALISKSDFLIAERLHSIIGAVGVNTPFLCLASTTDRRVEGILHDMLGMANSTYYLNDPLINELTQKFDQLWIERENQREDLKALSSDISTNLANAAVKIKESMGSE